MTDEITSESLEIGAILRQLERAKRAWGTGEAYPLIEAAQARLRALQEQALQGRHRNPPMQARMLRGTRALNMFRLENRGLISEEAHAILYKHIEDGKQYRHDFVNPTTLMAVERNGRADVLITSPDGFPIWQDF